MPMLAAAALLPACSLQPSTPPPGQVATATATFTNPLLDRGPDPWVIREEGWYYFMASTGNNLTIRRTRDVTNLRNAQAKVVWTPPASGPYSKEIWAPELHKLDGKWYIYFAADDGRNENHRMYVLENAATNPLEGEWTFKGKIADTTDRWAIDGTVLENDGPGGDGQRYFLWSGWEGAVNGRQNIYIARMSNPWTIAGPRMLISQPKLNWETVGVVDGEKIDVNEGPQILKRDGRIFVVYSGSGCWTDEYKLGQLSARADADLMDKASWTKKLQPVFRGDPAAKAYAPGHNSFFRSPDGREDWIVYHANPKPGQGCGNNRSPRAQRFTWNADGTPNFGKPVAVDKALPKPSGS